MCARREFRSLHGQYTFHVSFRLARLTATYSRVFESLTHDALASCSDGISILTGSVQVVDIFELKKEMGGYF